MWDLIISLLENHTFDDVHLKFLQVLKILRYFIIIKYLCVKMY